MRRAILTASFLLFWAFGAGAAMACTSAEVSGPGEAVRTARAALMQVPVGEMETDVPLRAQRSIEAVKDRIVTFVTTTLRCTDGDSTLAAIQSFLAANG